MARRTATFSLSPTTKRNWLKALRSGKFKQGRHALFDPDTGGYCCLGVLCSIEGASNRKLEGGDLPAEISMFKEVVPTHAELPPSLRSYEPEDAAFSVLYNGRLTPLSQLNDIERLSFAKIANIIEKRVPTH